MAPSRSMAASFVAGAGSITITEHGTPAARAASATPCAALPALTVQTPSLVSAGPSRRSPLAAIVLGIAGVAVFLGLVLAGLVFFALAIAFPIAVPLAASFGAPVTPHDAELANRFAGMTWAFVGLSIGSFAGSLGFLALTIRAIAPVEE